MWQQHSLRLTNLSEKYIETRGVLISKWSKQFSHFTLVSDRANAPIEMQKFVDNHYCRFKGPNEYQCAFWGESSRLIVTPCSSNWFGTQGPCCKFDYSAKDFYSGPAFETVQWFMYSDDDMFVRPSILRAFLLNFDPAGSFIFGATLPSPRFSGGHRRRNRSARGRCRKTASGCTRSLLATDLNLRWDPLSVCTKPFEEVNNRSELVFGTVAKRWAPCADSEATSQCIDCLQETSDWLTKCFSTKIVFPGNMQPIIASHGALEQMGAVLRGGTNLRRICGESAAARFRESLPPMHPACWMMFLLLTCIFFSRASR